MPTSPRPRIRWGVTELARELRIPYRDLLSAIVANRVPATRIGQRWYFFQGDVPAVRAAFPIAAGEAKAPALSRAG